MSTDFPANRILVLERGAAAIRAGHARDAEAILTSGIDKLGDDNRRRLPGERALWYYRRALARITLRRTADASADLETALQSDPEAWVRGRIEAGMGQVRDLEGRRVEALAHYRRARDIARAANDPVGLAEANRLIRQPFTASKPRGVGENVHRRPGAGHDVERALV
jgi:hypothetical protein